MVMVVLAGIFFIIVAGVEMGWIDDNKISGKLQEWAPSLTDFVKTQLTPTNSDAATETSEPVSIVTVILGSLGGIILSIIVVFSILKYFGFIMDGDNDVTDSVDNRIDQIISEVDDGIMNTEDLADKVEKRLEEENARIDQEIFDRLLDVDAIKEADSRQDLEEEVFNELRKYSDEDLKKEIGGVSKKKEGSITILTIDLKTFGKKISRDDEEAYELFKDYRDQLRSKHKKKKGKIKLDGFTLGIKDEIDAIPRKLTDTMKETYRETYEDFRNFESKQLEKIGGISREEKTGNLVINLETFAADNLHLPAIKAWRDTLRNRFGTEGWIVIRPKEIGVVPKK